MAIVRAVLKSIGWNITNTIISTLQLIALIIFSGVFEIKTNYSEIVKNGAFLFFCSSFVVSTVFEYYTEKYRAPKLFEGLFFVAIPIALIFFIAILYCGSIAFAQINMDNLISGNIILVITSILYSIIYRSLKFYSWSKQ